MIKFSELTGHVNNFRLTAIRAAEEDYFEAVIPNEKIQELAAQLKVSLGAPVFPSRNELSDSIKEISDRFGGVKAGQTQAFCQ